MRIDTGPDMFEDEYPFLSPVTEQAKPTSRIKSRLLQPAIRLFGCVDDRMFDSFSEQLSAALNAEETISLELSTTGGDAETARRIALEIRLCREYQQREMLFFGKSFIYSAGVTILSAFEKECRHLSEDCQLLIHSRRLSKQVHFAGPLSANVQVAEEILAELKAGMELERKGFEDLAQGSVLTPREIEERAAHNWYLNAEEALRLGLVQGVF
jgi:ATP-dependent protease ClpP protease subunit